MNPKTLIDARFARALLRAAAIRSFRGEIWEDDADVPMGKGYANEGQPFDIASALYLKPVFAAIRDPTIRKVVIKAAVQTLKTFCVEKSASYFIKHDPGDMVIYDCDIEAANDHAKSRLGPMLHSVPGIALQIAQAIAGNRFDVTTTEFYLPGMTLRFWPLNESSTQRITLRYVFISDAFLAKRNGMIGHAIARTTQHPDDKKIIIESQGSETGDDFDLQWSSTNQCLLHVNCPVCGKAQPFEWERLRPADASRPGTYSGMQRGEDQLVLLPSGDYNAAEILRRTCYECFHCGGLWPDTPPVRAALDASAHYVAANPNANPEFAGFSWPAWINRRLSWGEIMLEYLTAKKALTEYGHEEAIKQWFQKRAARTWNPSLTQTTVKPITESYDVEGIPNEKMRFMAVDCQQDPATKSIGHFWYVARVVDRSGNSWQLARGYAKSWEEWIAVQKKFKIPNRNVAVDGRYWTPIIRSKAAEHRTVEKSLDGSGRNVFATWKILRGDSARSWRHDDGIWRAYKKSSPWTEHIIDARGHPLAILLNEYLWSTLTIGLQLEHLRKGGEGRPKFVALTPDKLDATTRQMERGDLTYENQMNAEFLGTVRNKPQFIEVKQNINHYLDCERMGVVLMSLSGMIGHVAPPEEGAQEAEETKVKKGGNA